MDPQQLDQLSPSERVDLKGKTEDLLESEEEPDFLRYGEDAPELVEEARKHKGRPMGFEKLDSITEGVSSGELVVITATTGTGKTTAAQSITVNLAKEDIPSLWYTLEVTLARFLEPIVENDPEAEWTQEGKLHKVSSYPIYFPKKVEQLNFKKLKSAIRYANLKHGVEHVFIDHLHYLLNSKRMAKARSLSMHIGDRLRGLRKIALETDVSIFLIVHTKKIPDGERPTLNSMRDSSFIGQEADMVLVLWRDRLATPITRKVGDIEYEEQFSPVTKIAVEKARRTGRKGVSYLQYSNGLYEEIGKQEAKFLEGEAKAIAEDAKRNARKTEKGGGSSGGVSGIVSE